MVAMRWGIVPLVPDATSEPQHITESRVPITGGGTPAPCYVRQPSRGVAETEASSIYERMRYSIEIPIGHITAGSTEGGWR